MFSVDSRFQSDLDKGNIPEEVQQKFENEEIPLSQDLSIEKNGSGWLIIDRQNQRKYPIRQDRLNKNKLNIYTEFEVSSILILEDVSFADTRYGVAVGQDGSAVIFQTTDGGKSWTRISFGHKTFHAVQCIKPNNIWVVGPDNGIYHFSFPYLQSETQ